MKYSSHLTVLSMAFRHFFKKIGWIFKIILFFFILLLGLLFTETGLKISLYTTQHWIPGTLTFKTVNGYLLGNFSIEQLHYHNDDLDIDAKSFSLDWEPRSLLEHQFAIKSLNITQANIMNTAIQDIHITGSVGLKPTSPILLELQASEKSWNLKAIIQKDADNIQAEIIMNDIKNPKNILGEFNLQGKLFPLIDIHWTLAHSPDNTAQSQQLTKQPSMASSSASSETFSYGQLNGKGSIQGKPDDLSITTTLEGKEIHYQQIYLKTIQPVLKIQHFSTEGTHMKAVLDIQLNPGDLMYEKINDQTIQTGTVISSQKQKQTRTLIPFQKAGIQLQWQKNTLQAKTTWIFDKNKRFEGNTTIRPLNFQTFDPKHLERQHLSGNLLFAMSNLNFLNEPSSKIKKIQGTLNAKFKLAGTLAKPLWDGLAQLQARAEIPEIGLVLNPIDITVNSDPKKIRLNGRLVSQGKTGTGNNALVITGESAAPFTQGFNAKITGSDFTVMNTKEYIVRLTPDLNIQWASQNQNIPETDETGKKHVSPNNSHVSSHDKASSAQRIVITGTIDVPYARIEPLEFSQSLELPSDVVFVSNKKQADESSILILDSQVNVRLGKDVQINTHGLTGKLEGSVLVIDKSNEPTMGTGQIHIIDGKYAIYGKSLDVNKGEATFTGGAIDNPQLSIQATRKFKTMDSTPTATEALEQSDSITVGIEIIGYLKNPVIRLFSNPATFSQSDILSLLVLGRPASQASSADTGLLLNALSALNIGGGESTQITQQLQSALGLDTFKVETNSQYNSEQNSVIDTTSLVLGKALSSKIFLDYSVGLTNGTNILKIKYLLTPHWMFQSQTDGINEGADIIYHFSRD